MAALEPVGSLAIKVVPLLERLLVQGVLITGEGTLLAAVVVDEVKVVLEDGSADVADATVGEIENGGWNCELDG
jgi:hypothetical protein